MEVNSNDRTLSWEITLWENNLRHYINAHCTCFLPLPIPSAAFLLSPLRAFKKRWLIFGTKSPMCSFPQQPHRVHQIYSRESRETTCHEVKVWWESDGGYKMSSCLLLIFSPSFQTIRPWERIAVQSGDYIRMCFARKDEMDGFGLNLLFTWYTCHVVLYRQPISGCGFVAHIFPATKRWNNDMSCLQDKDIKYWKYLKHTRSNWVLLGNVSNIFFLSASHLT